MKKTKLIAAATLFSSLSMAFGATLQFDIGGGDLFDGTNNATNAPAGIADTFYNGLNTATPISSSLVFGDGTAATGVTAEIADGVNGALDFFNGSIGTGGNNNGSNTSGTGVGGTDLTNDWAFTRNGDNLGFRVTGLDAGFYDVYALVREPNQLGRTYDVGIGVGDTSDIADLTTQSIAPITDNTVFQAGGNFVVQTVEVTSTTDFITLIVDPTAVAGNNEQRFGTLGGVQIVAVPEPSSALLLGLGAAGFLVRRRRA